MSKATLVRTALLGAALLLVTMVMAQAEEPSAWPQEVVTASGDRIFVHQPQFQSWENYETIEFLCALEVQPRGLEQKYYGAVWAQAATETDLEDRTVLLTNPRISKLSFPDVDADLEQRLTRVVSGSVNSASRTASLDDILAMMDAPAAPVANQKISYEPPAIHFANRPTVLVVTDGEPLLATVEGTGLQTVVNTNWDLFLDSGSGLFYLLNDGYWLSAPTIEGPWAATTSLPSDLGKLPADDNWDDVRSSLPGRSVRASDVPQVLTTTAPAELVVVDGKPLLARIPGTALSYVSNTEADLFAYEGKWYYCTSGRWFVSSDLSAWSAVGPNPPAEFSKIPSDSKKADVLASIPGTRAATEAIIQAQIPQKAEVSRADASVDVIYSGDPQFEPVKGTDMRYAVNTPFDVIRVGDLYYCCFQGVWFVSTKPTGPWVVTDRVDKRIYTIPADCPVHHVTYVRCYEKESSRDKVVFGFLAGYLLGAIISDNCIHYGSGWHWRPWIWRRPGLWPVFYPRPYTYGCAAWYNPLRGCFVRRGRLYGPYGGLGFGATFNPWTGRYVRGVAAYGPRRSFVASAIHNPRTGVSFRGTHEIGPWGGKRMTEIRNSRTGTALHTKAGWSPYGQWKETVVRNKGHWLKTNSVTSGRGAAQSFQTSGGLSGIKGAGASGQGFLAKTGKDEVYAGKNGRVYRRADNGWQVYQGGSWQPSVGNEPPPPPMPRPGLKPPPGQLTRPGATNTPRPAFPKAPNKPVLWPATSGWAPGQSTKPRPPQVTRPQLSPRPTPPSPVQGQWVRPDPKTGQIGKQLQRDAALRRTGNVRRPVPARANR